jgi:hypothetical protein
MSIRLFKPTKKKEILTKNVLNLIKNVKFVSKFADKRRKVKTGIVFAANGGKLT